MPRTIPSDAIEFVREIFSGANADATNALAQRPLIHEEQLDMQLFAAVDKVRVTTMPGSGAAVRVQSHWLGGRRHFERTGEIGGLALINVVRHCGGLLWRNAALLQSKRLYPDELPPDRLGFEDLMNDAERLKQLMAKTDLAVPLTVATTYQFDLASVYGALRAGSDQIDHIASYQQSTEIPVYYSFYNPPKVPCQITVPHLASQKSSEEGVEVGCRVLRSDQVHAILAEIQPGKTPSFGEIAVSDRSSSSDPLEKCGWKLESFIADEMLRCREGRKFKDDDYGQLTNLLHRGTNPAVSAIVVTIDMP